MNHNCLVTAASPIVASSLAKQQSGHEVNTSLQIKKAGKTRFESSEIVDYPLNFSISASKQVLPQDG